MSWLSSLPDDTRPAIDRNKHRPGIVHLGIGAFHRAHQAVYTDKAIQAAGGDWLITGVSLRSDTVYHALHPQANYYTVWSRQPHKQSAMVVSSVSRVVSAPTHGANAILGAIGDPQTRIVSLTITEKGYCARPDGSLDTTHPDIQRDLQEAEPTSAIGYLTRSLIHRAASDLPLTVLSCDNLMSNGTLTRGLVLELAHELAPNVVGWIEDRVRFPCSMVDRIVPATTDADRRAFAETFNYEDRGVVVAEPWSQWVIEDQFAAGRPAWEHAGVELVADVEPYEIMKLRLLNATHSACAYLGLLAGHTYIHEAIADPEIREFAVQLTHEEVRPTLNAPPNVVVEDYCNAVLERFSNSAVPYRTAQVATDGSQKLQQRLLPAIRERLRAGGSVERLATVVAAWMLALRRYEFSDPIRTSGLDDPIQLLGNQALFGELADERVFQNNVRAAYERLSA